MKTNINKIIKDFLPPIFVKYYNWKVQKYRWYGNYKSWDKAKSESSGYDSDVILQKTMTSLLKVKNGEAIYARDSVILDKIEYSYPVLAALMWIALNNDRRLNLIDFGGSLGAVYFQNKVFLESLKDIRWNIVEQKHFVECGKAYFENEQLRFYASIDDCLKKQSSDTVLCSGVIQYIEKPYGLINSLVDKDFEYIIFDRTTFNAVSVDKLVVQKVNSSVFNASYPCWFLNISRFKEIFKTRYFLVDEFNSFENTMSPNEPVFKGFIYRRK